MNCEEKTLCTITPKGTVRTVMTRGLGIFLALITSTCAMTANAEISLFAGQDLKHSPEASILGLTLYGKKWPHWNSTFAISRATSASKMVSVCGGMHKRFSKWLVGLGICARTGYKKDETVTTPWYYETQVNYHLRVSL